MSFALVVLVMSIVAALGLRALVRGRALPHFLTVASRLAHPAGTAAAPSVVLMRDGLQEGWALIDRALRARGAVRFDVR